MEKFLPVSSRDFEQMITENFLYVDKTRYIYRMVRPPQAYCFLARPRRFGKSLTISTLASLFEGKKELFKGLWIENSDWPWTKHPVVKIDFNGIDATNAKVLEKDLLGLLDGVAEQFGLTVKHESLPRKFVRLLTGLYKKYQQRVVVLIDEYDKPIITHLGKGETGLQTAEKNREILKKFFGVLKEIDVSAGLRFVFITGISKFSHVSIFSDLNNLDDLSMDKTYAGFLGYTQKELEDNFGGRIDEFAETEQTTRQVILHKLREWYDGYRFSKRELLVYNPHSIVRVFSKYEFENFWSTTGTPSFLINLIRENDYAISAIEDLEVSETAFSTYDLENLRLEALLFQTGYVTIHDFDGLFYRLSYPNQEVKAAFTGFLYENLVRIPNTTLKEQFKRLHQYLGREDHEQFIETVNAILSAIPHNHPDALMPEQREAYYHTIFYLMVAASGVLVHTEVLSSKGRTDIAVEFKDKVYVIELKCNQPAKAAIQQIHDKGYHEKYRQSGRAIHLMGINFDTEKRVITDWLHETAGD